MRAPSRELYDVAAPPHMDPTKAQVMEKRKPGRFPNFLERAESKMPPYVVTS
jgi:hypothetical protein